jgi:uncharacterized protein
VSELAALERWWSGADARMAVVWGRRRVGKTALVRRFAEGRRAVFHTGAGRGQGTELGLLTRQVSGIGVTGIRDLVTRGYTDWDDALDHLALVAEREPLLLVLDEFPELATATPELPTCCGPFSTAARDRASCGSCCAGQRCATWRHCNSSASRSMAGWTSPSRSIRSRRGRPL